MSDSLFRAVTENSIATPKPVPTGKYSAKLVSYSVDQLPPWINFVFEINGGKYKGKRVGYSVKPELVIPLKSISEPTLFTICSSLLGREIEAEEFVDLDDLLGLSCFVSIDDPRLYEADITVLSNTSPNERTK